MTRPSAPTPPPAPSLDALVDDMTRLWTECQLAGKKEEAIRIFDAHPGARENLSVALRTCTALEELLNPGNQPQAQAGTTPTAPAEQKQAEEDEGKASEDEIEGDDPEEAGEDAGDPAPALEAEQASPPPAATPEPFTDPRWPDGSLGAGFLSALAATLASGEGVQLNLCRAGGTLLHVTITPRRALGEAGGTALPLVVSGTPAELDRDMLDALGVYGAARQTARDAANELLRRAHEAAEAAKQAKQAAPPTSQRACQTAQERAAQARLGQQATFTVQAPAGSVITLTDQKGDTQALQPGVAVKLDPQKISVKVELEGHQPSSAALTLKAKEEKTLDVTLTPLAQSGLF